jgi:hypothetical protein
MRALIIVALVLIGSRPALAGDDQDEDVSGVRVGNQMIWSDGRVSPIFRDDDSDSAKSQYGHKSYDSDNDSSHQSSGYTYHPNGRACRVIDGVPYC